MRGSTDQHWWLSSEKMTVVVYVDSDGIIVNSWSPITRRFMGQPLDNLRNWMKQQGGYREERRQ